MTRKHKRHHKDEKDCEESEDTNKSLKLVLKVGSHGTPVPSPGGSVAEENETPDKRHKHKKRRKHKDKKDKKRREDEDSDADEDTSQTMDTSSRVSDGDESDTAQDEPVATPAKFSEMITPSRSLRERKTDGEKRVLNYLLDYLHKILTRKDVNGFFQFPVTDQIAPRYSEIISNPMDFSTIRKKLDSSQYSNVSEYKYDFRLMLENCMAYNHPDTIFHKEAQRLLTIGLKQLSKEKLLSLKRSLPNLADITDEELGLKDDTGDEPISCVEYKKPRKGQMSKYEALVDDASPEDILSQVQVAAQMAATELREKNGNSKMGYLKKKKDGSTYLNVLNPDNTGIVSETERVVNIGGLMEKLKTGTGNLAGFREDKRNKAIPLSYLTYGPFSSYAPIYDSTTANLSKQESDLLLGTYGDEGGAQYSKSIQNFVENSGDYAVQMVDNLLEILTGGRHLKTKQYFAQKENMAVQQEEKQKEKESSSNAENYDLDSLKSLSKLGIDMSFLDSMDKSVQKDEGSKDVQEELNRTSELLSNLNNTQHQRLSAQPPPHLAMVPGPSDKEASLAEKLTQGLTGLAKQVNPSSICSTNTLRTAMRIAPSDIGQKLYDNSTLTVAENHSQNTTESNPPNFKPDSDGQQQEKLFLVNNNANPAELSTGNLAPDNSNSVTGGGSSDQQLLRSSIEGAVASIGGTVSSQFTDSVNNSTADSQYISNLFDSANFSPRPAASSAAAVGGGGGAVAAAVDILNTAAVSQFQQQPGEEEGFGDVSNGMDTSETEAAVANILG